MRRSIFHRQTPNKLADKLRPVGTATIGHSAESNKTQNTVRRIRNKLTNKNIRIGAILTIIAASIAWMGQRNPPPLLTTEQSIALPDKDKKDTTEEKPAVANNLPAIKALPVATTQSIGTQSENLNEANEQAIHSAQHGDPLAAVNQLEAALLNDKQAGLVFDNLRKLYAGFATQSYQLAMDPNKNQAVIVELSDAQQKYNIEIPAMATNGGNRLALASNSDTPKTMPLLPPVSAQTTIAAVASNVPTVKTPIPTPPNTLAMVDNSNNTQQAPAPTIPKAEPVIAKLTPAPIPDPVIKRPEPLSASERKEINAAVMQALKNWSDAWSKQDVDAYIASYSSEYTPKGTTHKEWADYRRTRLTAPKFVKVELSDQKAILIDNTHVRVIFTQSYASDTLKAKDKKTLELELINNTWHITSESGR